VLPHGFRDLHEASALYDLQAGPLHADHPGLALGILTILMGSVIDSIKNAMSVDDTQLEDELDAFYPRWSRTDFEFDPRRYQR